MHSKIPATLMGLMTALPLYAADLTIAVTNISEPIGELRWELFDNKASYDSGETPLLSARNRGDSDSVKITVHELPAGRYAVRLFHDTNNNGKMDTNIVGLPTEGYGFSNNAGRFGPPSFDEAAIKLENDLLIDIRMR